MIIRIDSDMTDELRLWFRDYVGTFKNDDNDLQTNIDIKEKHTGRVTEEIICIGKELGLSDDELKLAEVIALFHDIGRFEQYYRYRTFSDQKSEDHAELGIKILLRNNVLGKVDEEIQKLIFCSIRYHNRPSLPGDETKICLFYSRLIRDADKLDILRVISKYYQDKDGIRNEALVLELADTPGISEEVYQDLMNKRIVNIKQVRNLNDFKLLQAGWIYDINFKPTLDCIKKRGYLENIKSVLPESEQTQRIFETIDSHLLNWKSFPDKYHA